MVVRLCLAAWMLAPCSAVGNTANPVRRVISLLQNMQSKVEEEGNNEKKLYEQFECYCETGGKELSASISAAEAQIAHDSTAAQEAEAMLAQLESDLKAHTADREEAKGAVQTAVALRESEAAAFAKDSGDLQTNIAALGKAIAALEKGSKGSFLQTSAAAKLRQMSIDMDMSSTDRDMLSAFLSERQSGGYAPQGGEIIGILKQMKDTMEKDLATLQANEQKSIGDHNALTAAKTAEIEANTAAIETKTVRRGQVGVDLVNFKESVDDNQKSLEADKGFLANLGTSCKTKKAEFELRVKTRQEELLALAETIKILSDDDALELFKKTLPTPSLIQLTRNGKELRKQALKVLKSSKGRRDPRLDLVMLALAGKSKSFDNVIKMIDEMVALLAQEQKDDDAKKVYCDQQLDVAEDKLKELERTAEGQAQTISVTQDTLANLKAELTALATGIQELDKSVAEATEIRKKENAEYQSTVAANKAAKDLLALAKNRLNQFYNPALYAAPAKTELSAQQRIAVNMGSEDAPTKAPSGIAGTGITVLAQEDDEKPLPPPPETFEGPYKKKGEESNGVMAMIDMLVADLDKDTQEAGVEEKNAQAGYEKFMEDSRNKRAQDSQSISDKEGEKAELEVRLQETEVQHKATQTEAMATSETIKNLHLDCDWLVSNFDARKEARAGEVDSLNKAKAVLSGADFSFLQKKEVRVRHMRGA